MVIGLDNFLIGYGLENAHNKFIVQLRIKKRCLFEVEIVD